MSLYADTSFLVSYDIADANSTRAEAVFRSLANPLVFTGLHRLEIRNAIALSRFRNLITPTEAQRALADLQRDLRARLLVATGVNWRPILRPASLLAEQHTPRIGSRSLDVLHVAAAKRLGATTFFSFDSRQRALAQAVGLEVQP